MKSLQMKLSQHYQSIVIAVLRQKLTMFVGKHDTKENISILLNGDEEACVRVLFSIEAARWDEGTVVKVNYELGLVTLNSYMICQSQEDWLSMSYQCQLNRANINAMYNHGLLRRGERGWFTANGREALIDAIKACGNDVSRVSRSSLFIHKKVKLDVRVD